MAKQFFLGDIMGWNPLKQKPAWVAKLEVNKEAIWSPWRTRRDGLNIKPETVNNG